ncbi:hypothetical protein LR48_Vigan11g125300 [Vigna angularis]|uniref:Uncharacterized protein n=1 Tax=Phaseolus angularis TaxID=3914 RepID=A0A0L9VTX3_PHAAN|nr:hypothetical protein LR48_Vigan11g125300 [Vigna angularis]
MSAMQGSALIGWEDFSTKLSQVRSEHGSTPTPDNTINEDDDIHRTQWFEVEIEGEVEVEIEGEVEVESIGGEEVDGGVEVDRDGGLKLETNGEKEVDKDGGLKVETNGGN